MVVVRLLLLLLLRPGFLPVRLLLRAALRSAVAVATNSPWRVTVRGVDKSGDGRRTGAARTGARGEGTHKYYIKK